jgi:hypothetical protein
LHLECEQTIEGYHDIAKEIKELEAENNYLKGKCSNFILLIIIVRNINIISSKSSRLKSKYSNVKEEMMEREIIKNQEIEEQVSNINNKFQIFLMSINWI